MSNKTSGGIKILISFPNMVTFDPIREIFILRINTIFWYDSCKSILSMILKIIVTHLTAFLFCFSALGVICGDFLSNIVDGSYYDIYGGQSSIGKEYALAKALHDAKIDYTIPFEQLTPDQIRKLKKYILKELEEPIPAVRSPSGKIFLRDRHHSVYIAYLAFGDEIDSVNFKFNFLYDSKKTEISEDEFIELAIQSKWFYEPTSRYVLEQPLNIHELENNVERSLLGLFFMSIEDEYDIPMRGKYFKTFIQFYLADFIRENRIMVLPSKVDFKDIENLREQLLRSKAVLDFLIDHLIESSKKDKLEKFLKKRKSKIK